MKSGNLVLSEKICKKVVTNTGNSFCDNCTQCIFFLHIISLKIILTLHRLKYSCRICVC